MQNTVAGLSDADALRELDEIAGRSLVSRATLFDHALAARCYKATRPGEKINLSTGELIPHSCEKNERGYCGKAKRRKIARAAGAADPEAFLTLTQAGDEFSVIGTKMRNLRRNLERHGYPLEWV